MENQDWKLFVLTLKEAANKKEISQQKLSDLTGIKRTSINRFFSLKHSPNINTFLKISEALGVDFIFQDEEIDLNECLDIAINKLNDKL